MVFKKMGRQRLGNGGLGEAIARFAHPLVPQVIRLHNNKGDRDRHSNNFTMKNGRDTKQNRCHDDVSFDLTVL